MNVTGHFFFTFVPLVVMKKNNFSIHLFLYLLMEFSLLMNVIAHIRVLRYPMAMHRFHKLFFIYSFWWFFVLELLTWLLILFTVYVLYSFCAIVNMNENPPTVILFLSHYLGHDYMVTAKLIKLWIDRLS